MDGETLRVVTEACAAGAALVEAGLALSTGGNLSVRAAPNGPIAVTATGAALDALTQECFSLVDPDGTAHGPPPSSEWRMHYLTMQAMPEVHAIVHAHPHYAVLLDALDHPVRCFSLDHAFYLSSIGRIPFHPNGSDCLAQSVVAALREHPVVVMGHHGIVCRGEDVREALRRSLYVEQAARATYEALVLGDATSGFPAEHLPGLRHA